MLKAYFLRLIDRIRFIRNLYRRQQKLEAQNRELRMAVSIAEKLQAQQPRTDERMLDSMERCSEMIEARAMGGAGPWQAMPQVDALMAAAHESYRTGEPLPARLRETMPPISIGAFGDIELALQNVEWRREVNFTWLEFSRWGIQQIILICRLYYIKNPIIRRLVNVGAAYVFARGVEISSEDEDINAEIDGFIAANPQTLGKRALTKQERDKDTDGNIFWVFFDDSSDTGDTSVRVMDATEIQDIITDPDDADCPWYYHRVCSQNVFDPASGDSRIQVVDEWYPALNFNPDTKPATIKGNPVHWTRPIYHCKAGTVGKWKYGCPRMYPAIDWAKEARKYLEACASVKQSNAQIARDISTKGGQQAIMSMKQQLQTTVGPSAQIWDTNPTAVAGSTWVSGPGTDMSLVKMRGVSDDPEEVRQYKLMCCMVADVPETFLGDVSTGNLATATTLDRPTETAMLDKQEAWREDLSVIVIHHLKVSKGAPKGKVREALERRGLDPAKCTIRECRRVRSKDGVQYAALEVREGKTYEAGQPLPDTEIVVRVNFPAIREGDMKTLVDATVAAMTLENKAGQVIGIDEKAGVRKLYDLLGFDDGDELAEEQYPDSEYDPDRTQQELPAPIPRPTALPGGIPSANAQPGTVAEALRRVQEALREYGQNGHAERIRSR